MSKNELLAEAKSMGIKGYSRMNKQELEDAIKISLSVQPEAIVENAKNADTNKKEEVKENTTPKTEKQGIIKEKVFADNIFTNIKSLKDLYTAFLTKLKENAENVEVIDILKVDFIKGFKFYQITEASSYEYDEICPFFNCYQYAIDNKFDTTQIKIILDDTINSINNRIHKDFINACKQSKTSCLDFFNGCEITKDFTIRKKKAGLTLETSKKSTISLTDFLNSEDMKKIDNFVNMAISNIKNTTIVSNRQLYKEAQSLLETLCISEYIDPNAKQENEIKKNVFTKQHIVAFSVAIANTNKHVVKDKKEDAFFVTFKPRQEIYRILTVVLNCVVRHIEVQFKER